MEGICLDKKLVCPCGLVCCDCLFHKSAIYDTARRLKELIAAHQLDKFLTMCSNRRSWMAMGEHLGLEPGQVEGTLGRQFAAFAQLPAFMTVLDSLINLHCQTTCQEAGGCQVGGAKHECKALKCLKARGYDGCWQCGEISGCDKLAFLKASYGHVIEENLRTVREKGPGAVEPRGDKYYAWQRRGE